MGFKKGLEGFFSTQSKKLLRSTIMYEFMRDSLMLHYYSALLIFNCIPDVEKQFGSGVREKLIQHTYPELMVLRWAQEEGSTFFQDFLLFTVVFMLSNE